METDNTENTGAAAEQEQGTPESTQASPETGGAQFQEPESASTLEDAIVAGQEGRLSSQELVAAICSAELLSVGRFMDEADPATFQALVLKSPEGETAVAATFTSSDRIPPQIREKAPVIIKATGEATIRSIAPGYGMALNPGSTPGLELGAEGVAAIVAAYEQAVATPPETPGQ